MCLLACLCLFYHLIFKYNMRRVSARQLGSKWEFQCVVLCSWCRQCLRTCEPLHESFRWVDWYHTKSECTNEVLPNGTWISKTSRAGKRDGWYILEEGKTSRRHHFRPYTSRKEHRAACGFINRFTNPFATTTHFSLWRPFSKVFEARYSVSSAFVFTWARSLFIGPLRM